MYVYIFIKNIIRKRYKEKTTNYNKRNVMRMKCILFLYVFKTFSNILLNILFRHTVLSGKNKQKQKKH